MSFKKTTLIIIIIIIVRQDICGLSSLKCSVFWVVTYAKNSKKITKNPRPRSQFIPKNYGEESEKTTKGFRLFFF